MLVTHVWFSATPWIAACQVPLFTEFSTRILEWGAAPFTRGSFPPRGRTQVSCLAGRFFTIWATRKLLGCREGNGRWWCSHHMPGMLLGCIILSSLPNYSEKDVMGWPKSLFRTILQKKNQTFWPTEHYYFHHSLMGSRLGEKTWLVLGPHNRGLDTF